MMGVLNRRLLAQLAPPMIGVAAAFVLTSSVDEWWLRIILQVAALFFAMGMAWRAGQIIDEMGAAAPMTSGIQSGAILQDRRRPVFDPDTGLCANWYFRLRIEEEKARAKRYQQPLTLIKLTSESERALRHYRGTLKKQLRQVDIAADFGDAIAVMLPNTDRAGAETAIERLALAKSGIEYHLAEYPSEGETLSQLLGEHEWQTTRPEAA